MLEKAEDFRATFPDGQLPSDDESEWVCDYNPWFDLYDRNGDQMEDLDAIAHGLAEAIADAEARLRGDYE